MMSDWDQVAPSVEGLSSSPPSGRRQRDHTTGFSKPDGPARSEMGAWTTLAVVRGFGGLVSARHVKI
jgi:hypothetical protein